MLVLVLHIGTVCTLSSASLVLPILDVVASSVLITAEQLLAVFQYSHKLQFMGSICAVLLYFVYQVQRYSSAGHLTRNTVEQAKSKAG